MVMKKIEFDVGHSIHHEERYRAYGYLNKHGGIVVVFVEVIDDLIRIISAYKV